MLVRRKNVIQFIVFCLFVSKSAAGEVDDKCILGDEVSRGICTLATHCQVAIESIENRRFHQLKRCGFQQLTEIVCCPITSDGRFDGTLTPTAASVTSSTSKRKSVTECKKNSRLAPPPLRLNILGGEEASPGEFPHMAALGYVKNRNIDFQCGGSLISTTYILTAAHCVVTLERIEPSVARLGVVFLGQDTWNSETDHNIVNLLVHPQYGRPEKYHDLSLLRLDKAVDVSSNVHPACLYTLDTEPSSVIVTGWGAVSNTKSARSSTLLKANLTTVPNDECNSSYATTVAQRKLPFGITEDQMCAGDREGKRDTCQGDSGGPLQALTETDGFYRIIGITSFGRGCGSAVPGVYTKVSRYLDWIESVVWP